VAGDAALQGQLNITGLKMAVNTMAVNPSGTVFSHGYHTIDVSDVDGVGEFTPGVELFDAEGGAISITAQHGLILNDAHSHDAVQGRPASTAGSLFARPAADLRGSVEPGRTGPCRDLSYRDARTTLAGLGGTVSTFKRKSCWRSAPSP
jgi:hypothetical protein